MTGLSVEDAVVWSDDGPRECRMEQMSTDGGEICFIFCRIRGPESWSDVDDFFCILVMSL